MELRTQKTTGALIAVALLLAATASAGEFRYEVRHRRLPKSSQGTLIIGDTSVSFRQADGKKRALTWAYQDIQQLEIAPKTLRVLTYRDNMWKLGADREYRFDLLSGTFTDAYNFLKSRLDERFVAALADGGIEPLRRIPAKHLTRFGGSQGELIFGRDRVVFETDKKNDSRTWRYSDIDSVSTSGPFQLTLTTFERARSHYGDRKGFNFQLKQALPHAWYNELWQRVNGTKEMPFLSGYKDGF
ncbi:MAG: hypothetical protein M1541_01110 [Acidobacteria bacterium]|nr:hypothetical protein [Acidobacteriota bacterium]